MPSYARITASMPSRWARRDPRCSPLGRRGRRRRRDQPAKGYPFLNNALSRLPAQRRPRLTSPPMPSSRPDRGHRTAGGGAGVNGAPRTICAGGALRRRPRPFSTPYDGCSVWRSRRWLWGACRGGTRRRRGRNTGRRELAHPVTRGCGTSGAAATNRCGGGWGAAAPARARHLDRRDRTASRPLSGWHRS